MRVEYLTGERVHLRPATEEDAARAMAWFISPFPINASRAKTFIDEYPHDWWDELGFPLVIARTSDDEVIGGVKILTWDQRVAGVRLHMAPVLEHADELQAEALRIVIPWLRDEHEMMAVRLRVAADEPETIAVAEALGMQLGARLREFVARGGERVDELIYEALNPRWEVPHA